MLDASEGYTTDDGRAVLDGAAALWCVNAGHCRPKIVEAVQRQVATLDFAPTFQFGHPGAFTLASQMAQMFPGDLDHVFFTNSGSEANDTNIRFVHRYYDLLGNQRRSSSSAATMHITVVR